MYDERPTYPVVGGRVGEGIGALAAEAVASSLVALDGPPWVAWDVLLPELVEALGRGGRTVTVVDVRSCVRPWDTVLERTAGSDLPGDQHFLRLSDVDLADLLDLPTVAPGGAGEVVLVAGPGACLVGGGTPDVCWYADVPRDVGLAALRRGEVANLGQPGPPGDERRLTFVDWPILDRHRAALMPHLDCVIDAQDPRRPTWLPRQALRATLAALVRRPFRTRPHFHPGVWGGQWMRERLGIERDVANLAWSYELIAPEAGVRLGADGRAVEIGLDAIMALHAGEVLGDAGAATFGRSFPIRFDYLDTWGGEHLSVHCHPRPAYMRSEFGWPYTQHETYYVMDTRGDRSIFLGLAADVDLDALRADAEAARDDGVAFDITAHVRVLPAARHQLYLVPAGTPHGSGEGNVVLEISATPYAYSLRLYDWLRSDLDGSLRPVHVEHAMANVTASRRGAAVDELVQRPEVLRSGDGWRDERIGALPELFFEVRRSVFDRAIDDDTAGRCHVLNLVQGRAVDIVTAAGDRQPLHYGETVLIPAVTGAYRLERDPADASGADAPAMAVRAVLTDG